ncbi:MAG: hypothetical protein ACKVKG_11005 [Alphaproteobacteria bacterium]|jgi:hypothetical protein
MPSARNTIFTKNGATALSAAIREQYPGAAFLKTADGVTIRSPGQPHEID